MVVSKGLVCGTHRLGVYAPASPWLFTGRWSFFSLSSALRLSRWVQWGERRQVLEQGIFTSLGLYSCELCGTTIKSYWKIWMKWFIVVGGRDILWLEVSRGWRLVGVLLNAEVWTLSWRQEGCSENKALKCYLNILRWRGILTFIWGLHNLYNTHNKAIPIRTKNYPRAS